MDDQIASAREKLSEVQRQIDAIHKRLTALENDTARLEEILIGDPSPQQVAEGKRLGIVGMLQKGEEERAKMRRLAAYIALLVTGKMVVDAPESLPKFLSWLTALMRHL